MTLASTAFLIACLVCTLGSHSLVQAASGAKLFASSYIPPQLMINKVTFTQRGYIQFLKYLVDVPPLTDYTFCMWVRSSNFTYSQPLFSYSKNEEERLIRVWISPQGHELNLDILEFPIFRFPVHFKADQWYHVCQSWSAFHGAWNIYLNGKLAANGFSPALTGRGIKGGGDIVVGQEYTDFDKGLEDGIEGDVYGFNFVLASTLSLFRPPDIVPLPLNPSVGQHDYFARRNSQPSFRKIDHNPHQISAFNAARRSHPNNRNPFPNRHINSSIHQQNRGPLTVTPLVLKVHHRERRGLMDMFYGMLNMFKPAPNPKVKTMEEFNAEQEKKYEVMAKHSSNVLSAPTVQMPVLVPSESMQRPQKRLLNEIPPREETPLGLLLVELSYNCALGKGAPLSGEKVLVSWTRTTVRVFGGAIMKPVLPFCLNL